MQCFHCVYIFRKTYDKHLIFSAPDNRGKMCWKIHCLNLFPCALLVNIFYLSWLKKIIWVTGVLRRTVVIDWRFNNLCGSHLQSQVVVLVSWKFKNPGERFDWSVDRVAVGKCVRWLAVKTCAGIGYANRWVVKWIINKVLLFPRVATVREKSGKNKNFSRSGKSQGILQKVRENLSSCQSQWKVREFCFQVGARFCEDYENIFIRKIKL